MARAIWSGSISFGLVNIPVKLFSAIEHKEVRFHMVHDADGARIQEKRVCSADGREVPWEHIAKGYEISKGRVVMITPEELQALDPKATKTIDIEQFVDLEQIDPIYFEQTYYLAPEARSAKAYGVLLEALERQGKVAVARVVLRTKQYLCMLRPRERVLVLATMLYADEIRQASELEGLPATDKPNARELTMAEQLIEALVADFQPDRYRDEYREKVLELIRRKAKGESLPPPKKLPAMPSVTRLSDALAASLRSLRGQAAGGVRESSRRRARPRARPRRRAAH